MEGQNLKQTIAKILIIIVLVASAEILYKAKNNDVVKYVPPKQPQKQEEVFEAPNVPAEDIIALIKNPSDPDIENINIEPMKEFSGMKVKDILSLRKSAVVSSPVPGLSSNYEPSTDVFRIEDNLPWISAHEITCNELPNKNVGNGPSRESVGILNPELFYYLNMVMREHAKYNVPCGKEDYLIPYRAYYNKKTNTVTALIKYSTLLDKHKKYQYNAYREETFLHDANAKDLGYKYGYADVVQNIHFVNDTFTKGTIATQGYYHRGYACRLDSGCNNYSPMEVGYDFIIKNLPARIHIKMWKNQPSNPSTVKADLNYEMIFD